MIYIYSLICAVLCSPYLHAQLRVDRRNVGERLICIVPMIGTGAYDDPKRPLYAPVSGTSAPKREAGEEIISFQYEVSDDGKSALVEFVATSPDAFKAILSSRRPDVRVFRKGQSSREEIEEAFRAQKKDFRIGSFVGEQK